MLDRLRRGLRAVLDVDDSPHRVALAFGIGIFIAFSPLIMHTVCGLALAFAMRLNRPTVVIAVWVNNPWTQGPMLFVGTVIGCVLLGIPPSRLSGVYDKMSGGVEAAYHVLRPFLAAFLLGNFLMAGALGVAAYFLMRWFLDRRQARRSAARAAMPVDAAGGAP